MTVLVTGTTGFIGSALVPALRAQRCTVRTVRGDLTDPKVARRAVRGIDAVIHLASDSRVNYAIAHPFDVIGRNTLMLGNLLEAIQNSTRRPLIIFASTDRMYGATRRRMVAESEPPYPIEPYTASKIIGEILLKSYEHTSGIPWISLRMDGVYGPGQPARMFIADVIVKMLAGKTVKVGDLSVSKNFVYVGDVVNAFLRALRAPRHARNQCYSIGGAEHVSLRDIIRLLGVRTRYDASLVRTKGAEVRAFRLNLSKARRLLGWRPATNICAGLAATVASFQNVWKGRSKK